MTVRSDEYCRQQREDALENFDLNMAFFAQIPEASFDEALTEMLRKNKRLRPVTDLRSLDGEVGLYVLVLDDYRQAYIGRSWDLRRRIKSHWSGTKQFDRLLWGGASSQCYRSTPSGPWTRHGFSPRAPSTRTSWRPGS